MSHNELSRRTFLKFTGISLGAMALAACAPPLLPKARQAAQPLRLLPLLQASPKSPLWVGVTPARMQV